MCNIVPRNSLYLVVRRSMLSGITYDARADIDCDIEDVLSRPPPSRWTHLSVAVLSQDAAQDVRFQCPWCDYTTRAEKGLSTHTGTKHLEEKRLLSQQPRKPTPSQPAHEHQRPPVRCLPMLQQPPQPRTRSVLLNYVLCVQRRPRFFLI